MSTDNLNSSITSNNSQNTSQSKSTNKITSIHKSENTPSSQESINIPSMRLYPEIPISYNNTNSSESLINNFNINSRKYHTIFQINDNFFENILKNNLSRKIVNNTINRFITETNNSFIEKIKNDSAEFNSEENATKNLSLSVVQNMSYSEFKKGKSVFRVGELKDKLFFIIKGKILSFKPIKKIGVKMSLREYLSYCLLLIKNKEEFLLNKVLEANYRKIPVISAEEIKHSYNILFKIDLCKYITNLTITNNKELINFFNSRLQDLESYNLSLIDLEILRPSGISKIKNLARRMSTAIIQKPGIWENYILKKCKPKLSESNYFEKFEEYLKIKKVPGLVCYIFSFDKIYESGSYFGDIPLTKNEKNSDEKDIFANIRHFSTIAEEDSFLGCIKNDDFMNIVAPMKKKEKLNDLNILCSNYFLKGIAMDIFDKNYYHLFSKKEYKRDNILFEKNAQPTKIFLLRNGIVSLNINCSIFELNNIINFLYNKLINFPSYNELLNKKILTKKKINTISEYCTERCLKNMRMHNEKFIKEINKNRNYQIANIQGIELIGAHEEYFNIPYITNCVVSSEKILCYELSLEGKEIILAKEKNNFELYTKCAINKLLSIIERLQNIKRNFIDMLISKYEKPSLFEMNNNILLNSENNEKKRNNLNENMRNNNISVRYKKNLDITDPKLSISSNINLNSPKRLFLDLEENKMKQLLIENQEKHNQSINNNSSDNKFNRSKVNSSRKLRKRILRMKSLSDVYLKERAGSVDLRRLNEHNKLKNKNKSKSYIDAIFLGDKYMTLNELEKYTNDYSTIEINHQKKYKPKIKNKKKKSSGIYKENSYILKPNKIVKTENNINQKFNTIEGINNLRGSREIQNNNRLILNYVPFLTSINEKQNRFNCQKSLSNVNVITETSKEAKQLPNIYLKGGFNKNVKDKNKIISQPIDFIIDKLKVDKIDFVPMMVKEYYNDIKKKGCVPFIGNKNTNTIFLRKFGKKYKENNIQKSGEKIMSNELPKIKTYDAKNLKLHFLNTKK